VRVLKSRGGKERRDEAESEVREIQSIRQTLPRV